MIPRWWDEIFSRIYIINTDFHLESYFTTSDTPLAWNEMNCRYTKQKSLLSIHLFIFFIELKFRQQQLFLTNIYICFIYNWFDNYNIKSYDFLLLLLSYVFKYFCALEKFYDALRLTLGTNCFEEVLDNLVFFLKLLESQSIIMCLTVSATPHDVHSVGGWFCTRCPCVRRVWPILCSRFIIISVSIQVFNVVARDLYFVLFPVILYFGLTCSDFARYFVLFDLFNSFWYAPIIIYKNLSNNIVLDVHIGLQHLSHQCLSFFTSIWILFIFITPYINALYLHTCAMVLRLILLHNMRVRYNMSIHL